MHSRLLPLVLALAMAAVTQAKDPSKDAATVRFLAESAPVDLGPCLLYTSPSPRD